MFDGFFNVVLVVFIDIMFDVYFFNLVFVVDC